MSIIFTFVYEKVSYTEEGFGERHLQILIEIRNSFYCLGDVSLRIIISFAHCSLSKLDSPIVPQDH